jgi:hypothetical protein
MILRWPLGTAYTPTTGWVLSDEMIGRIAGRFPGSKHGGGPGRSCRILFDLRRKSSWTLTGYVRGTRRPMQHLLAGARWDAGAVHDDLRDYVLDHVGDPGAVSDRCAAAGIPPQLVLRPSRNWPE